jgi:hypothetical protein
MGLHNNTPARNLTSENYAKLICFPFLGKMVSSKALIFGVVVLVGCFLTGIN